MNRKTVLLVDDEQGFLEALSDALLHEGHRVLKARDVSTAVALLRSEHIDLISIDVMLSPGPTLNGKVEAQKAGVYLCKLVAEEFPDVRAVCLSVVNDPNTIRTIRSFGVRFLRKGETPLRTVLSIMNSCLGGVAYSA